jgi:L-amino acid N-acyltransferase YncA
MIRTARVTDAAAIAEIHRPYVTDTFISSEGLERFPWLVSETGGRIDGYAYASQHRTRAAYRWSVDVTAYAREGMQRRGISRALYSLLLPILARIIRVRLPELRCPTTPVSGCMSAWDFCPLVSIAMSALSAEPGAT